jgi:hypothetical protein
VIGEASPMGVSGTEEGATGEEADAAGFGRARFLGGMVKTETGLPIAENSRWMKAQSFLV